MALVFHSCGDVTTADEELQNLGLQGFQECWAFALSMQGGIFIVIHLM
jgi:hypothetical protein